MLTRLLLLGAGGSLGTLGRYGLTIFLSHWLGTSFPFGTLGVNLIGCFFIGLLSELFRNVPIPEDLRLFFMTGILGGFTTFSAFGLEAYSLAGSVSLGSALIYILSSISIGLLAVWAGMSLTRLVWGS